VQRVFLVEDHLQHAGHEVDAEEGGGVLEAGDPPRTQILLQGLIDHGLGGVLVEVMPLGEGRDLFLPLGLGGRALFQLVGLAGVALLAAALDGIRGPGFLLLRVPIVCCFSWRRMAGRSFSSR
jgi:hypothetical protein